MLYHKVVHIKCQCERSYVVLTIYILVLRMGAGQLVLCDSTFTCQQNVSLNLTNAI